MKNRLSIFIFAEKSWSLLLAPAFLAGKWKISIRQLYCPIMVLLTRKFREKPIIICNCGIFCFILSFESFFMESDWFLKVISILMKKNLIDKTNRNIRNQGQFKDPFYEWNFFLGHSYIISILSGRLEILIFVEENLWKLLTDPV